MSDFQTYLGDLALRPLEDGAAASGLHCLAHQRQPGGVDLVARASLRQMIDHGERPRDLAKAPLFISYYTPDTPYEGLAAALRASLDRLGLEHRIEPVTSLGSWVANTGLKSAFIERVWQDSDRPVCWLDADAELRRHPWFLYDNPADFAIVRRHGWYDISSLVYLGRSAVTGRIISRWADLCRLYPETWDQPLLTAAWFEVARDEALTSHFLPATIFRIPRPFLRDLRDQLFYYPRKAKMRPFVDQKQASRAHKSFMDRSAPRKNERGSDDVSAPFRQALSRFDFSRDFAVEAMFDR
ncbi:hypothetical protein NAC44_02810 [Allorhizobium sp. BGMRC 0089]|uniref:hypothetical protein n=1 Tax=Allorhizobium sonneratiae TaxID=2934936 RepID=UPI0020333A7F|nr:hypothetical protein [Allorhizobium sonneratiae]MCM2291259.1 hypothetical protein [Allorhizobium sonneratiae]